jgi:ABC-type phosphate/phosphonate transport system substrate-binding protein
MTCRAYVRRIDSTIPVANGPRAAWGFGRPLSRGFRILLLAAGLAFGATPPAAWSATEPSTVTGAALRTSVGFSELVFGKMDIRDITAATRTWAEIILRRETGRPTQVESQVYPVLADMQKDLAAKKLDMVALLPQEYLDLKGNVAMDPILLAEPPGAPLVEYLLMVRKESGLAALSDLHGTRLTIEALGRGTLPWLWLESVLKKAALPRSSAFFASAKEEYKGSQAVLSVFFKKADVGVAARHSFETMAAMNPQVGHQLTVLATSPGFAHGLMILRPDVDGELRSASYRGLLNLHSDATGRQVLTLFRTGRMIPFKPEQIKSVEDLLRESRQPGAPGNG